MPDTVKNGEKRECCFVLFFSSADVDTPAYALSPVVPLLLIDLILDAKTT